MRLWLAGTLLALAGTPVLAHRLDEYLQGTILSIEKNRVHARMTLTPGVAVFPRVLAAIDTDSNGVISDAEQRAYAERVLGDLSVMIDGRPLTPQLVGLRFPAMDEMKEGRGEIGLDFAADLPGGGRHRKLTLENRHEPGIAAYQVNCAVPRDPAIRISAQNRNYSQSSYVLEYEETDAGPDAAIIALGPGGWAWLSVIGLLMFIGLAALWLRSAAETCRTEKG